jgi:hypothetical protein
VPEGVLVKVFTAMVSVPEFLVSVTSVEGSVIAYVYVPSPVTSKEAAATVPVDAGSVTPPVGVRPAAGDSTTVPALGPTATLPKFMSPPDALAMAIGATMVAVEVAVAEAEAWAKEFVESAISRAIATRLYTFFMRIFV